MYDFSRATIDLKILNPEDQKDKRCLIEKLIDEDQLVFWEDYIEQQYSIDYEHYYKKKFTPPRSDWGGQRYYFGKKLHPYSLKNNALDDHDHHHKENLKETIINENELNIVSEDNLINKTSRKTQELPNIFKAKKELKKKNRPKDCIVTPERIYSYAKMIEDLTRFPMIHMGMQNELESGWKHLPKTEKQELSIPKKKDPYSISKEDLRRVGEKYAKKDETRPSVKVEKVRGQERKREGPKRISGGRYEV